MRIVKGFWKILVGIKDALVLLLLLLFFAGLYMALSATPAAQAASAGALVVRLNGTLVEQPTDGDALTLLTGSSPATREFRLREVIRALRLGAIDPAVKVVVLDLDSFAGGGQAAIGEAGAAVDAVRRAGKPVLAFATGYADDSYQLAAHASELWLDPIGAVLIQGPGSPHLYYKGLLDKLGVTAHVYRVGRFKSAVEPFVLDHASPEAREANQALADSLWASWRDEVRKARPAAALDTYVGALGGAAPVPPAGVSTNAAAALADHMVDRLGDRIAFGARVADLAGAGRGNRPGDYAAMPLERYVAAHPAPAAGRVGVLTVAGDIVDGERGLGSAGGDTLSRLLLEELGKGRIKALVVRVDSPGGSVTASERIRSAILAARVQGLPVVVSMGSVAASGGYWVSTPAQAIFAEPATITGSIGVFGIIPTFQGTLAKLGLSADGVATTPLSGQPDVYRGTSPQFDRLLQTGIEDTYRRFTGLVADARHLTPQRVDEIGQGRVWPGGTARQIGLVDRFGGLEDAVAFAANRAGLTGADARPRFIEREPDFWSRLARSWAQRRQQPDESAAADPLTRLAGQPQALLLRALGEAQAIATGPAIQVRCLACDDRAASMSTPRHGWRAILSALLGLG